MARKTGTGPNLAQSRLTLTPTAYTYNEFEIFMANVYFKKYTHTQQVRRFHDKILFVKNTRSKRRLDGLIENGWFRQHLDRWH